MKQFVLATLTLLTSSVAIGDGMPSPITGASNWPTNQRTSVPPTVVRRPASASDEYVNRGDTFVPPEVTTALRLSNRDVNRVHCPGPIGDVMFSQEKPMSVTPVGQNLFVKFLVQRQGAKEQYTTTPADLHVVCGGQVYTMIVHPHAMDSVTVRLGKSSTEDLKNVAQEWGALPLEERVKQLTLAMYKEEVPPGFSRSGTGARRAQRYQNLSITPVSEIRGPGSGLSGQEYEIRTRQAMRLPEKAFLRPEFGDVVAITVEPSVIHNPAGGTARLFIIQRVVGHE